MCSIALLGVLAEIIKVAPELRLLDASSLVAVERFLPFLLSPSPLAVTFSVSGANRAGIDRRRNSVVLFYLVDDTHFTLKLRKPSSPKADSHADALRMISASLHQAGCQRKSWRSSTKLCKRVRRMCMYVKQEAHENNR